MTRKRRKAAGPVPALPGTRLGAPADADRPAAVAGEQRSRAPAMQDAGLAATRKRRPRFVF